MSIGDLGAAGGQGLVSPQILEAGLALSASVLQGSTSPWILEGGKALSAPALQGLTGKVNPMVREVSSDFPVDP